MAYTTINYNEDGKGNLGYKSVELHYGNEEKKYFNSGDFMKDWYNRTKFIVQELLDSEPYFMNSSSIDHFIMDGAPYDSAFLHVVNDVPVLKYVDCSDPNWWITQSDIVNDGIELFVPENIKPTWEELKKMCE